MEDYNKHGKDSRLIMDKKMAKYADALILVCDGRSKDTENIKSEMEKLDKLVYTFEE